MFGARLCGMDAWLERGPPKKDQAGRERRKAAGQVGATCAASWSSRCAEALDGILVEAAANEKCAQPIVVTPKPESQRTGVGPVVAPGVLRVHVRQTKNPAEAGSVSLLKRMRRGFLYMRQRLLCLRTTGISSWQAGVTATSYSDLSSRSSDLSSRSCFNSNPKRRLPALTLTPSLFVNKPPLSAPTPQ